MNRNPIARRIILLDFCALPIFFLLQTSPRRIQFLKAFQVLISSDDACCSRYPDMDSIQRMSYGEACTVLDRAFRNAGTEAKEQYILRLCRALLFYYERTVIRYLRPASTGSIQASSRTMRRKKETVIPLPNLLQVNSMTLGLKGDTQLVKLPFRLLLLSMNDYIDGCRELGSSALFAQDPNMIDLFDQVPASRDKFMIIAGAAMFNDFTEALSEDGAPVTKRGAMNTWDLDAWRWHERFLIRPFAEMSVSQRVNQGTVP